MWVEEKGKASPSQRSTVGAANSTRGSNAASSGSQRELGRDVETSPVDQATMGSQIIQLLLKRESEAKNGDIAFASCVRRPALKSSWTRAMHRASGVHVHNILNMP